MAPPPPLFLRGSRFSVEESGPVSRRTSGGSVERVLCDLSVGLGRRRNRRRGLSLVESTRAGRATGGKDHGFCRIRLDTQRGDQELGRTRDLRGPLENFRVTISTITRHQAGPDDCQEVREWTHRFPYLVTQIG